MPTLGEKRVRHTFNPSGDGLVYTLKEYVATFIDICNENQDALADTEQKRLWALAMTAAEEAAMWAVKAATFQVDEHGSKTSSSG